MTRDAPSLHQRKASLHITLACAASGMLGATCKAVELAAFIVLAAVGR